MEIGRIQWKVKCAECGAVLETSDPEKLLPEHKANASNYCSGSGKVGIVIGQKIDPKII